MKKDYLTELQKLSISDWKIEAFPEVQQDLEGMDHSQIILTFKAIKKVSGNPLPVSEGGYGKPLGNKHSANLSGFLKIKLLRSGIRIIYFLRRQKNQMVIVVVGVRKDDEVYHIADERKK